MGTPKSSILIGFSIINRPFWGKTPILGNLHIVLPQHGLPSLAQAEASGKPLQIVLEKSVPGPRKMGL